MVPQGFKYKDPYIYDIFNNQLDLKVCDSNPCWKIIYNLTTTQPAKKSSSTKNLCTKIFMDFMKSNLTEIHSGDMSGSGFTQFVFRGESPKLAVGAAAEVFNRPRLKDLDIWTIMSKCEGCVTKKNCKIAISF